MPEKTFWLRVHVEALTREVNDRTDQMNALIGTLKKVCPEFQAIYESLLAAERKSRAEQMEEEIDMRLPLTSQPLSALHKKFREES